MSFTDYANALQAADRKERDRLLRRAREDAGITVREYLKLENLDAAMAERERRRKSNA